MNGFENVLRQNSNSNALISGKIITKAKIRIYFEYDMSHDCIHTIFLDLFFGATHCFANAFLQKRRNRAAHFFSVISAKIEPKKKSKLKINLFDCHRARCHHSFISLVRMFYDYVLGAAVNDNAFFELNAIIQWPKKVMPFHMRTKNRWILSILIEISLASELRCDGQFKCGCQYVTCLLHEFLFAFASMVFCPLFFSMELSAHQEHANQVKYL